MQSSQTAHPIFTFADGEMGPISNTLIRSIERFSGQPKIRKLYFDYVEEDRPYASFWADALDKLSIQIDLQRDAGAMIPPHPAPPLSSPTIPMVSSTVLCSAR